MVQFTEDQQKAINHTGHDILVSASAGSGKTAVLVQRVIQKVLTGTDVDQLLIVTFTRLAAQEMKTRIQTAVEQQIQQLTAKEQLTQAAQKKLHHFRRQMNRLNLANISTIHAFCEQIIHKFYYLLGIDPEFTILEDAAQTQLLKQSVFATIREAYYNADDEAFFKLTENFSNDRDDNGLEQMIFELYDYSRAFADDRLWLKHLVDAYQLKIPILSNRLFTATILPHLRDWIQTQTAVFKQLQSQVAAIDASKYQDFINQILTALNQINNTTEQIDYSVLKTSLDGLLQVPNQRRGTKLAKAYPEETEQIINAFNDLKTQLKQQFIEPYFSQTEDEIVKTTQVALKLIKKMQTVLSKFGIAFQAEKNRRNLIDFSDLEHLAFDLLNYQDEQGQYPVQAYYQQRFSEVLIDEYQDINPLQESLLSLVAHHKPGNRFMVGDIKQSIYGFRMADPSLFAQKYQQYPLATNEAVQLPAEKIVLADNFRSKHNITNFVNYIFSQYMDEALGDIAYDQAAQLHYGAKYYDQDSDQPVEVLLQTADTSDHSMAGQLDAVSDASTSGSIYLMAQRIQQMIAQKETIYDPTTQTSRPIKYSDIAILVPTRNDNLQIIDVFKQQQIPLIVSDTQNYFQTTELRIMIALLQIIDNPDQDIPLVAVLRSPIVALDENELGYIRGSASQPKLSYYACLQETLAEQHFDPEICRPDFLTKLNHFADLLTHYRSLAKRSQLADLIWEIYNTTGFLDYVSGMPSGPQRAANLNALYTRATQYEANGFKGLFQFIKFIENMQANDKDLAEPDVPSETTEAVQIMTIHKSKGLEFPVVFVFALEHTFNQNELRQKYIFDQQLGIGIDVLTEERIKVSTLQKNLIKLSKSKQQLSEALRLLYVAVTRAQQRLLLVGDVKDSLDKIAASWQKSASTKDIKLPLNQRFAARSFLDIIGPSLVRGVDLPAFAATYQPQIFKNLPHEVIVTTSQAAKGKPRDTQTTKKNEPDPVPQEHTSVTPDFLNLVERRFNYHYNNLLATQTTAYQSVSDIKRQFDDPDLEQLVPLTATEMAAQQLTIIPTAAETETSTTNNFNEPTFLKQSQITPTQLGTATHLVFQKLDLTQPITPTFVKETIAQLVARELLTAALAEHIDIEGILAFYNTDLGQAIRETPEQFYREVTFSMVYPAQRLFAGVKADPQNNVLIHGMIDGYLITADGVILVDYKTDHKKALDLAHDYQGQLNLYALALKQMLNRPIAHKYLYGLIHRQLIEI
ncbi:helicase-exonuclease AddAB subunit AddA [Agrilactobacillus fermenti]|uniref:helicase-exonuclease AddAB subunit AddA n=1 Tax=Agrilactobacillus fermenti TaxID=2586909 RepID=UPI001E292974|nr:helicase-exonuclease AddAB subunit AddA [Agrilactobacillus fermenti]MCD2255842.1 helicase-exonuclease AddAB subunit AddA [Agrilactobacillus fermenti]